MIRRGPNPVDCLMAASTASEMRCIVILVDRSVVERFRNRWVAIQDDGHVVADAETLDRLLETLEALPPAQATIQRIPAADEPLFVGLR
jgi:ABC-type hemin transport system ATPase subunit